jgi:hydrogenase nickel incorporation protein HypA/HybF
MHELSVCQSIVDQVTRVVEEHQGSRVDKIYLQVGPLSGVEPGLLQSAFPLARANSVASHAELIIRSLPVRVLCKLCGAETQVSPNRLLCGECGDWQTQLLSGDELLLERVELHKQH